MNFINQEKYFEKKMDILKFFISNNYKYSAKLSQLFKKLFFFDECLMVPNTKMPTFFTQILSKFGVLEENCDVYLEMLKLLEKYSFLEGNCLEVSAGIYPRLAEVVSPVLNVRGGSLTIYDPDICYSILNKSVVVKKENFTFKTNIDGIDTLYGLYPCSATIPLLEKAFDEDKNLLVGFCDCDHSTDEYPRLDGKYWADDICMYFKQKYQGEFDIIQWPSRFESDFPIMVRESTKTKEKKLAKKIESYKKV